MNMMYTNFIQWKLRAGLGIKPGSPASLVRSDNHGPSSLIYHIPPPPTITVLTLKDSQPRLPLQDYIPISSSQGQVMAPNVVGIAGVNIYQMKINGWTTNWTRDPCITSQEFYHWSISNPISWSIWPIYRFYKIKNKLKQF